MICQLWTEPAVLEEERRGSASIPPGRYSVISCGTSWLPVVEM